MNLRVWARCKHDWQKRSEVVLPSAWEQLAATVKSFKSQESMRVPPWFFEKKTVIIFTCDKCGAFKKVVEKSP